MKRTYAEASRALYANSMATAVWQNRTRSSLASYGHGKLRQAKQRKAKQEPFEASQ